MHKALSSEGPPKARHEGNYKGRLLLFSVNFEGLGDQTMLDMGIFESITVFLRAPVLFCAPGPTKSISRPAV